MKVSVIVSTYNGALKLPYLLDALALQSVRDFELIIAVDGSVDNTLEVLDANAPRFDSFRVIGQNNSGRSKIKNKGAKESTGELLIFYDDDMVPCVESVERHINLHLVEAEALVSGNPVELWEQGKSDIQNYKALLTARWTRKYVDVLTRLDETNLFFSAANCSVRRGVFERLGGFDERLTDGEDFHLALRALQNGCVVLFDKSNTAVHRDFITARSYVLRLREYRKARENLMLMLGTSIPAVTSQSFSRRVLYAFFARAAFVRWIDSGRLLFLPAMVRYKLYDIVIHSLSSEYPDVAV